ncbi:hypothetical protein [Streptomyces triticisoli]|uniref:hypothetical protein n=1 Tax=Streptomyces triticisoli TaxID=2182797 RepID=UPI000DD81B43|nr:hypothetical protein [Streptomyces triticisoli]
MDIAALITRAATALGGLHLLGAWIRHSGIRRQQSGTSRLPAPVVFGHFALARTSFGLLPPAALPGFVMPARWIPAHRDHASAGAIPAAATAHGAGGAVPTERRFPLPVVPAHGLFAVVTLVLVLPTALSVGSG